jgi:hypothetical protein
VKRRGVLGVVTLGWLALVLTSCGASAPGTLTQSDIPASVGMHPYHQTFRPIGSCSNPVVAAFKQTKTDPIEIAVVTLICPDVATSQKMFETHAFSRPDGGPLVVLKHVGDSATLFSDPFFGPSLSVWWRKGDVIGLVNLMNYPGSYKFYASLVVSLAKRSVARA